jgi:hypothetical protein
MINMFARITKVDEAKREVWGRLVQEVPDRAGEIFDYETSKPHFKAWSDEFAKATEAAGQEISLGNMRAMHGKVAAGKFTHVEFNDAEKAIDVCGKVVDDGEWNKVLEGVYTGYSIGGSYVGDRKPEKIDGVEFKRYTAKPTEGSLVDSPCVPTAKFFEIRKADGAIEKVAFKPAPIEVRGTDEEVAALGKSLNDAGMALGDALVMLAVEGMLRTAEEIEKREFSADERKSAAKSGAALPDGSFPIHTKGDLANAVKAYGRAKDKAAAKAHIIKRAKALGATDMLPEAWTKGEKSSDGELKKGLWNVGNFASLLSSLANICHEAQEDFDYEGDNSPVPMKLRNAFADLVEVFKEMADEEATEMLASLKEHAAVGEDDEIEQALEAAIKIGALKKRLTDPELPFTEFVKIAQAELTPEEFGKIKGGNIAEATKQILEKAGARHSKVDAAHLQEAHDHLVGMGADCNASKAAPASVQKADPVEKQLTDALARIAHLEKQPMPHVITLRTVQKTDISGAQTKADALAAMPYEKLVKFADGTIDWKSSELLLAAE